MHEGDTMYYTYIHVHTHNVTINVCRLQYNYTHNHGQHNTKLMGRELRCYAHIESSVLLALHVALRTACIE